MDKLITDLHGDTYQVGDFHLYLDFPDYKNIIGLAHTMDIITHKTFNLIRCKNKAYGVLYSHNLGLFIGYELNYISHDDLKDIRKGHLYGNIYHS